MGAYSNSEWKRMAEESRATQEQALVRSHPAKVVFEYITVDGLHILIASTHQGFRMSLNGTVVWESSKAVSAEDALAYPKGGK